MIKERDYQAAAAEATIDEITTRGQRTLLVMPTGSGKSVMLAGIVRRALARKIGPILVTVHKTDLVEQLADSFRRAFPNETIAVEQGVHTDLSDGVQANISIASIQTLQTRPEVATAREWGLVMTDECHRAVADGYQQLYEAVGCFSEGKAKLIGATATDFRGDEQPLSIIFESVSYKRDLEWAIKEGWLVRPRAERVKVELSDGTTAEIASEELQKKFMETFLKELSTYKDGIYTAKHPMLVMASSVPEGRSLEEKLREHGVKARMVDSLMDPKLRHQYTQDFREQKLDVLIGYNLFIEGFDAPHSTVLCMLRNTNSQVTYVQALGRVLRPFFANKADFKAFNTSTSAEERLKLIEKSGKPHAYLYDFTTTASRYDLWTIGRVFGLSADFNFEGDDVLEAVDEVRELADDMPFISIEHIDSRKQLGLVLEDITLWREAITPNAGTPSNATMVYAKQGNVWRTFFQEQKYFEETKSKERITWSVKITQDARGEWQCFVEQPEQWKVWYWNGSTYRLRAARTSEKIRPNETTKIRGKEVPKYIRIAGMAPRFLISASSKAEIFYLAEQWVYNFFPRGYSMARRDTWWRSGGPSDGQMRLLKRIFKKGIPMPEEIDKGLASLMIDLWFAGFLNIPNPRRRVGARRRKRLVTA